MRLLACCTFSFSAYIFFYTYFDLSFLTPVLWLLLLAASCIALVPKIRRLRIAALIVAGISLAGLWCGIYENNVRRDALSLTDTECDITAFAIDYSSETAYGGTKVEAKLISPVKARIILQLDESVTVKPGDKLTLGAYISPSGSDSLKRHYESRGFFISGTQTGELTIDEGGHGLLKYLPKHISHKLKNVLSSLFESEDAAVIKALLTGDKSGLNKNEELMYNLQRSGLSHLVAVSGMHVSFLLALVSLFIRSRRGAGFVSVPLMLLFCGVTGFAPGVVRACVMRTFVLMAWHSEREGDSVTALSAALALLLAVNPYSALGVSLQLSFASTLGLVLLSEKINGAIRPKFKKGLPIWSKILRRAWAFAASVISASVSAWVFTAPLCALYFDMISIVSPFSNLLTLWSVPGAFILGAAAGIFGAIWLPLGIPFAFAARLCVRYFAFVARITGDGALSSVHASSWPIRVWLAATYAAIVIALALKNRKKAVPIAALFSSALLSVSLLYINLCPLPLTMNVLDVGQGACTVFLSRDTAVMVDCGGDDAGQKALSYMRSRGLESLDILVLTHLHKDHISGAKLLLSQIDVGCVIVPEGDEGIIRDIENNLGKNSELIRAADGVAISTGEVSLEIMRLRMPKNENDESLAVLCSSDGFNALITGDMTSSGERQLCARYSLPRCDVYVAGHHGDAASSGDELLSTIKPEIAVISCDEDNPYGHPDHETVQRLKKYGAAVLRTDIDGNISLPLERSYKNG